MTSGGLAFFLYGPLQGHDAVARGMRACTKCWRCPDNLKPSQADTGDGRVMIESCAQCPFGLRIQGHYRVPLAGAGLELRMLSPFSQFMAGLPQFCNVPLNVEILCV